MQFRRALRGNIEVCLCSIAAHYAECERLEEGGGKGF